MNKTPTDKERDQQAVAPRVDISGRFDQYRSSYWGAMIAAFGLRYAVRPFTRNFSEKSNSVIGKHTYSAVAGVMMESVTAFFAKRTLDDMKAIFAESLGWEFNKDPKDVTFSDFKRSKNSMVQQTAQNYVKYNLRRATMNAFFFVPLVLGPISKKLNISKESAWHPAKWQFEVGTDLGLGANAAYLYSDVISRKITPFEALQTAVDTKINHTQHAGDVMTGNDLLDIYERHAAKGAKLDSFMSERDTLGWNRSIAVFGRMADLMNQTYNNTHVREKADFSISKFIHLVGQGLIQPKKVEQTLAYVEVANRYGIKALNDVSRQVDSGISLSDALKPYPVTLPEIPPEDLPLQGAPEIQARFTQTVESRRAADAAVQNSPPASYTDKVKTDPSVGTLAV